MLEIRSISQMLESKKQKFFEQSQAFRSQPELLSAISHISGL